MDTSRQHGMNPEEQHDDLEEADICVHEEEEDTSGSYQPLLQERFVRSFI